MIIKILCNDLHYFHVIMNTTQHEFDLGVQLNQRQVRITHPSQAVCVGTSLWKILARRNTEIERCGMHFQGFSVI